MNTHPSTTDLLDQAQRLAGEDVPRNLRVSRCVTCDNAYAWKGSAPRPGCPACGGALTTTTRNLKRSTFRVLDGEVLAYAERLDTGLRASITWELRRVDELTDAGRRFSEKLAAGDLELHPRIENYYRPAGQESGTIYSVDFAESMAAEAAKHQAKADKYERRLAKLGGRTERDEVIAEAKALEPMLDAEGSYHGDDVELAAALDTIVGHGHADEQAGTVDEDGAHWARVGRFVLITDGQGFRRALTYPTERAASIAIDIVGVEAS